MEKKKIFLTGGALFVAFLMLMMPAIPAVQQNIMDEQKTRITLDL
ncbi:MAG: hypothetical protein V5A68_06150 [Candidatus Thermoplasmatota archaeon]